MGIEGHRDDRMGPRHYESSMFDARHNFPYRDEIRPVHFAKSQTSRPLPSPNMIRRRSLSPPLRILPRQISFPPPNIRGPHPNIYHQKRLPELREQDQRVSPHMIMQGRSPMFLRNENSRIIDAPNISACDASMSIRSPRGPLLHAESPLRIPTMAMRGHGPPMRHMLQHNISPAAPLPAPTSSHIRMNQQSTPSTNAPQSLHGLPNYPDKRLQHPAPRRHQVTSSVSYPEKVNYEASPSLHPGTATHAAPQRLINKNIQQLKMQPPSLSDFNAQTHLHQHQPQSQLQQHTTTPQSFTQPTIGSQHRLNAPHTYRTDSVSANQTAAQTRELPLQSFTPNNYGPLRHDTRILHSRTSPMISNANTHTQSGLYDFPSHNVKTSSSHIPHPIKPDTLLHPPQSTSYRYTTTTPLEMLRLPHTSSHSSSSIDTISSADPREPYDTHSNMTYNGGYCLFVYNLPNDVDEDNLIKIFSPFGVPSLPKIMRADATKTSRGFGFINMHTLDQAWAAVLALNGTSASGRMLKVTFKRPKNSGPKWDNHLQLCEIAARRQAEAKITEQTVSTMIPPSQVLAHKSSSACDIALSPALPLPGQQQSHAILQQHVQPPFEQQIVSQQYSQSFTPPQTQPLQYSNIPQLQQHENSQMPQHQASIQRQQYEQIYTQHSQPQSALSLKPTVTYNGSSVNGESTPTVTSGHTDVDALATAYQSALANYITQKTPETYAISMACYKAYQTAYQVAAATQNASTG